MLDTVKMENYDENQNYRFSSKNKMTKTIRIDMNRKINDVIKISFRIHLISGLYIIVELFQEKVLQDKKRTGQYSQL